MFLGAYFGLAVSTILIFIGLGTSSAHPTRNDAACTFCRQDQVAVDFTPLVSVEDYNLNRYNVTDLMPFIAKISSEFKVILCQFYDYPGISARLVPEAVAVWNVHRLSNDTIMEAWMDVMIMPGSENVARMLDDLYDAVTNANNIHHGTVTTLIFPRHFANLDPQIFLYVFTILRYRYPNNNFNIGLKWEPHAFESRMKHDPSAFGEHITNSYHLIDYIIFTDFLHDSFAYSNPPDELLKVQVELVKTCEHFVKQHTNTSIFFGVSGGISDTSNNGFVSYLDLSKL